MIPSTHLLLHHHQQRNMASSSATSQLLIFHELLVHHQLQYSRRLLFLNSHLNSTPSSSSSSSSNNKTSAESLFLGDGNFDANVIMVLSVLLCALFCSLGLNSIIRCALRCSNVVVLNNNSNNDSSNNPPPSSVANTGVKKKALKTFPTVAYSSEEMMKLPGLDSECAICLSEFNNGDRLRILPKCNHGFHVRCIDKWLSSHSSCPKCRHCLIQTCQKIVGSTTTPSHQPPSSGVAPAAETIVRIAPLEPEGMVRNYIC